LLGGKGGKTPNRPYIFDKQNHEDCRQKEKTKREKSLPRGATANRGTHLRGKSKKGIIGRKKKGRNYLGKKKTF